MPRPTPRTTQRKSPPAGSLPWQTHGVGPALRTLLQQLEIGIGLLPRGDAFDNGNRFQGATLLAPNVPTPPELRSLFPEELAELQRLGKSVDRCHLRELERCRVLCLPYFSFDGFNVLVGFEQDGRLIAAWKDAEAFQGFSPQTVHARVAFGALAEVLLDVLQLRR